MLRYSFISKSPLSKRKLADDSLTVSYRINRFESGNCHMTRIVTGFGETDLKADFAPCQLEIPFFPPASRRWLHLGGGRVSRNRYAIENIAQFKQNRFKRRADRGCRDAIGFARLLYHIKNSATKAEI